jgi:uncharacterized protein YrrD
MIKATDLRGLAVVDLDAAEKLGSVDEVIVDPEARRIAGFTVSSGGGFLTGGGNRMTIPASCVHALGHDAITVRSARDQSLDVGHLSGLPMLSQIVGHKVVTHSGAAVGSIDDVLIEPSTGRITGYGLGGGVTSGLGGLLATSEGSHGGDYIRAESDIKVGQELVVVPDDAVMRSGGAPVVTRGTTESGWPSEPVVTSEAGAPVEATSGESRPLSPPASTQVDWADTSLRDTAADTSDTTMPPPVESEASVGRIVRPGPVEEPTPIRSEELAPIRSDEELAPYRPEESGSTREDVDATQVIHPVDATRRL